jgi:hypothetical protein
MVRYRLVLTPTQKGSFIAVVPDMPRFCATRRIQAEVASHAADALRLRVKAVMRKDQIFRPAPLPALGEPFLRVSYGDLALLASHSASPRR